MDVNEAFKYFTDKLNTITDIYAALKQVKIPHKNIIMDPWMTRGLLTSSRTCTKLLDPNEIYQVLKLLKSKKSIGRDNWSTYFLKLINEKVAISLSILINKSLQTGVFPDSLKIAKTIPIYKVKAKETFSNCRPISLLSVSSDILSVFMLYTQTHAHTVTEQFPCSYD